jgi:hypothetical protein
MLHTQNSGAHAGILNNSRLVNALRQLPLRLDATLFISEVKDMRKTSTFQIKQNASAKEAREYSIRIVVYGLESDKEVIGDLLAEAGFFLQHPFAAEVIPEVQYRNPHYLLRPDAEMPKFKDSNLDIMDGNSNQTEPGDEISKSSFLRIFETAEADGGTVTVVNASPSPRLRSPLMKYDT